MTTQKFKVGDWVKCFERIVKVFEVEDGFYYVQGSRWVSENSVNPIPKPELIAHLEAKSNELIQAEFAAKNERYEIDRQIHLLKTNTEML